MATSRSAWAGSLPVQALSASTSKDRNMAEVYEPGQGMTCTGLVLAGPIGMPARDLLSGIDRDLFNGVGGKLPFVEQRLVGAVGDQRAHRIDDGSLQPGILLGESNAGELIGKRRTQRRVDVRLLAHHVRQGLVAL